MAEISKHMFNTALEGVDCGYLLHPWHSGSCTYGSLMIFRDSMIGSAKFYSIVYLAQILMRGRKMKQKKEWIKMAEYYVRSWCLGWLVCGSASTIGCIFWQLLGRKYDYHTFIMIPNIINGLAIYLEPPSRRGLVTSLFCNLVIEYWMKIAERAGYLTITKTKQTLMFMLGSSLLFYLMRLEGEKGKRTPLFWFFTPEKVRRKEDGSADICPHNGPCIPYATNGFLKLFGLGAAISLARIIIPKISRPISAIASVRPKHFKMAMFFGCYIGIYRSVICSLRHKRGFDSSLHALPAGYLAGMSFMFNPSLGFAIAALTGAFKLYSTILYEKKILPENIPLPELMYAFCQGTLFHARFMHPDVCPKYVFNLMHSVSNGHSEELYANMLTAIKRDTVI